MRHQVGHHRAVPLKGVVLVGAAGALLGLGAETVAFGWEDAADWLPDLLVGWTLIVAGLLGALRRPESRFGALLAAAGFCWFIGNFAASGWPLPAWIGAHLVYLHRGPLIHCVLSFPTGRLSSRLDRTVVLVGYLASVVTLLGRSGPITLAVALLVSLAAWRGFAIAVGPDRRARATSLPAALGIAVVLAGGGIARWVFAGNSADRTVLFAYEAVLVTVAVSLVAVLISAMWERAAVTDLVVELSERRSGTLRDALARALGDPSLQIGYWVSTSARYVDAEGAPVEVATDDPARTVTPVEVGGRPVAVLVHDAAVLHDPSLVVSIASAARLAGVNARLQNELRAQVVEVAASRRRLVAAGDDERKRLEDRLRAGAERWLTELASTLTRIREEAERTAHAPLLERIGQAERRLEETTNDLRELARGLHPRALTEVGLGEAVRDLARRTPIPVAVEVSADGIPPEVAAAAYFVCAEALANLVKHGNASCCSVVVEASADRLLVEIADDGAGGADPTTGTGLRGLADRVEALGGSFGVDSPPGKGTRLMAHIPLVAVRP
jgi:signal transduction histidine kinase